MSGRVEGSDAVWRTDCLSPAGGMSSSYSTADVGEQASCQPALSIVLPVRAPEFHRLPVSRLRTCHSVCCGVVLCSIVTRERGRVTVRDIVAERFCTPGVPYTLQDTARISKLNLRAKPPLQPGPGSFTAFPASYWLAPIDGYVRAGHQGILIGMEDLQNGKTKHTT